MLSIFKKNQTISYEKAMNCSMAIIEFKPDGTIIHANENFLNVMGYSLAEVVGKHHSIFVGVDEKNSAEYIN